MKVICVTEEDFTGNEGTEGPDIFVGDILTVANEVENIDLPSYEFIEFPESLWDVRNFARLNDPDETEIAEARAEREGVRLDCELVSVMERIESA